jgi:uncharacterized membrane protein
MSEQQTPPPRSVPFIISLCLNVALIAMIVVVIAMHVFHSPRPFWSAGPLGPYSLMRTAAPAERTKIETIVAAHEPRIRELTWQAAQARLAALGVFARPQFSASDYLGALDKVRLSNDALETEVSRLMAEAAAQLSPQERGALAERIRAHHKPFWRALRFRRLGR